jgi:hypothetical protein
MTISNVDGWMLTAPPGVMTVQYERGPLVVTALQ